ncbi:MAG: choloylglycine hydrolase family protein [Rhizobiales bacterium]|nr:choloylglycine hydrolase family protein [Hyphomicrobiales bacterium]OJY06108.1 MAG: choloylglycine hydrolase [Rhizobiales bacterium 63-22]
MKTSIWQSSRRLFARRAAAVLVAAGMVLPQAAQACTSFVIPTSDGGFISGRTMEFAFEIDSDLIVIPRNYSLKASAPGGREGKKWRAKYAAIGMNAFGLPALVDGLNEKGLSGGILYFPGYAGYTDPAKVKLENALSPWDFLSWALTSFSTVEEVKQAIKSISVIDVKQADMGFVPPVHYTLHDATGASIVVEPIDGKLKVYDNPVGVMTNAPSFDWHLTNLRNYVKLTPDNVPPLKIGDMSFAPFGGGSGMLGVPGDTTPPSRFIRATAFALSAKPVPSGPESVRLAEHIVNNFDIPKGWLRDPKTPLEYTQWSTIADMKNEVYYIKTYDNPVLRGIAFEDIDPAAKQLVTIKLQHDVDPPSLIEEKP